MIMLLLLVPDDFVIFFIYPTSLDFKINENRKTKIYFKSNKTYLHNRKQGKFINKGKLIKWVQELSQCL